MVRRQALVQLSDELLSAIDQHAARTGRSRSEIIRAAIERYLARSLQADLDRAIVEGYTLTPQSDDAWADRAARDLIAEEPW
jgi:metal-responsive CopG/Arc/MetJ family transcriptional regulator